MWSRSRLREPGRKVVACVEELEEATLDVQSKAPAHCLSNKKTNNRALEVIDVCDSCGGILHSLFLEGHAVLTTACRCHFFDFHCYFFAAHLDCFSLQELVFAVGLA